MCSTFVKWCYVSLGLHRKSFYTRVFFFGEHMFFIGATGTPVLDFWWCLSKFQSQSELCLICIFVGMNVMHIPQDPPLVLHVLTSWQPAAHQVTSPHVSADVGLGLDLNGQTAYQLSKRSMVISGRVLLIQKAFGKQPLQTCIIFDKHWMSRVCID